MKDKANKRGIEIPQSDYNINLIRKQEAMEALLIICILKLQQEIVGWQ